MKIAEKALPGLRFRLSIRTTITALIGIILFFIYELLPEPLNHLVRDIGMAFLIAAIVTEIYERYAREAAASESAEEIVGKLVSDILDRGVWRELREQIVEKVAVRKATRVELRLFSQGAGGGNRLRLWVKITYRLSSLRSRTKDVDIVHFLDSYMRDDALGLPRFISFVVGGNHEQLSHSQTRIKKVVTLGPRGSPDIPVEVEREELVYIPGAYSLLTGDLTELKSVTLSEEPIDTRVTLNFSMFDERNLQVNQPYESGRYLLPGQALEFRFTRNEQNEQQA